MTKANHEPQSLGELFKGADRIGRKYQTPQEVEAQEQSLWELRQEIFGGIEPAPYDPSIDDADIAAFECRFLVD